MVTAVPVHVPVGQLFLGRRPDGGDFDVEIEILAGEGVIAIERDHVTGNVLHGDRLVTRL